MMYGMADGSESMMWGMGWGGLLIPVLVVLAAVVIAKVLFFSSKR